MFLSACRKEDIPFCDCTVDTVMVYAEYSTCDTLREDFIYCVSRACQLTDEHTDALN